jgi:hypothetical protein
MNSDAAPMISRVSSLMGNPSRVGDSLVFLRRYLCVLCVSAVKYILSSYYHK